MNTLSKLDNFFTGLLAGLITPAIFYALYWLIFHHQMSFPTRFTNYLAKGYLLSSVVQMCGLGDLILFYFSLSKKMNRFSKGIILSMVVYLVLIAYLVYFQETDLV